MRRTGWLGDYLLLRPIPFSYSSWLQGRSRFFNFFSSQKFPGTLFAFPGNFLQCDASVPSPSLTQFSIAHFLDLFSETVDTATLSIQSQHVLGQSTDSNIDCFEVSFSVSDGMDVNCVDKQIPEGNVRRLSFVLSINEPVV